MSHRIGPFDDATPPGAARRGAPSRRAGAGDEPYLAHPENLLAIAAIERLLRSRDRSLSLCYIHGPSGVGKSHLVRHALRGLAAAEPGLTVVRQTASELAAAYAEATQAGRIAAWLDPLRAADVLICEDLQAIGRRPETQRVLTSLIDDVLGRGGRVVLTSDRMPGAIEGLSPRLRSRCRGGATAEMELPGPTAREALLSHFAARRQLAMTSDAISAAAARTASPRALQALVVQMEAVAQQSGDLLDGEFVRRFLEGEVARPAPSLAEVARATASHFRLRPGALRSTTRKQDASLARQCAMYLGRRHTGEPLQRIAVYFGRRHHTAVIQACRRTLESLDQDAALRHHLACIEAALGLPVVTSG